MVINLSIERELRIMERDGTIDMLIAAWYKNRERIEREHKKFERNY